MGVRQFVVQLTWHERALRLSHKALKRIHDEYAPARASRRRASPYRRAYAEPAPARPPDPRPGRGCTARHATPACTARMPRPCAVGRSPRVAARRGGGAGPRGGVHGTGRGSRPHSTRPVESRFIIITKSFSPPSSLLPLTRCRTASHRDPLTSQRIQFSADSLRRLTSPMHATEYLWVGGCAAARQAHSPPHTRRLQGTRSRACLLAPSQSVYRRSPARRPPQSNASLRLSTARVHAADQPWHA